jgi:hypothetical protein
MLPRVSSQAHFVLFSGQTWIAVASNPPYLNKRSSGHPSPGQSWFTNTDHSRSSNTMSSKHEPNNVNFPTVGLQCKVPTSALPKPPYVCYLCDKNFLFKEHYEGHMNVHNNIKAFKCPKCSREYAYKTSLRLHLKRCRL